MLMPDGESVSTEAHSLGPTLGCCCGDSGSIGCVRSHVKGAGESLERALGYEKFMKLGFCDMGESVAKKWTINMQDSFRRVVLSNPASSGRNFWHRLAAAFPARSSEELVGYYFNVFVLRKRAEQNRVDPLNTDSDNDEWGESSSDEKDDFSLECGYERNFSKHDEPGGEDCDH